jgi:hypothetical protein
MTFGKLEQKKMNEVQTCPFCGFTVPSHGDACPRNVVNVSVRNETLESENAALRNERAALAAQLQKLDYLRFAIYPNTLECKEQNRLTAIAQGKRWLTQFTPEELDLISLRMQSITVECNMLYSKADVEKLRAKRAAESTAQVKAQTAKVVAGGKSEASSSKIEYIPKPKKTQREKTFEMFYNSLACKGVTDVGKRIAKAERLTAAVFAEETEGEA